MCTLGQEFSFNAQASVTLMFGENASKKLAVVILQWRKMFKSRTQVSK